MREVSDNAQAAWVQLLRGGQAAVRAVEAALKAVGQPPLVWYDILLEIERAPHARIRQRDIHRHMLLERYNVSRVIERMEQAGLVRQEPCPDDRRGDDIVVTESGKRLRVEMWNTYGDALAEHFAGRFSDPELGQLADLLRRLSEPAIEKR